MVGGPSSIIHLLQLESATLFDRSYRNEIVCALLKLRAERFRAKACAEYCVVEHKNLIMEMTTTTMTMMMMLGWESSFT